MNERMNVKGRDRKWLWPIVRHSRIFQGGGYWKTLENLNLITWFPSQDSNQTHPDYKPELLSPEPGVHKYITHLKILRSWRGNTK